MENKKRKISQEILGVISATKEIIERLSELTSIGSLLAGEEYAFQRLPTLLLIRLPYVAEVELWRSDDTPRPIEYHKEVLSKFRGYSDDAIIQAHKEETALAKDIANAYVKKCVNHWRSSTRTTFGNIGVYLPQFDNDFEDTQLMNKLQAFAALTVTNQGRSIDKFRVNYGKEILRLQMKSPATEIQYTEAIERLLEGLMDVAGGNMNWTFLAIILMIITNTICCLMEKLDVNKVRGKSTQLITATAEKIKPFLKCEHINQMMNQAVICCDVPVADSPLNSAEKEELLEHLRSCSSTDFRGIVRI